MARTSDAKPGRRIAAVIFRLQYPLSSALLLSGCGGNQSSLNPAAHAGEQVFNLFLLMFTGAVVIWLAFVGLTIYSLRAKQESRTPARGNMLIVVGGAVVPSVVLGVLLVYGLTLLPDFLTPAPATSLRITVSGEQWWWRVRYQAPGADRAIELANEIRLPVGEQVEFLLESPDVIHSFWIPSLGGKMDMIPGRVNRLSLKPIKTGVFRGVCAEYCGTAHALMAFQVVVATNDEFRRWLEGQSQPAQLPSDAVALRGQELFLANGCGACHTIRGTPADGAVGPDLTHVGSRLSLAADCPSRKLRSD